jgi:hypothetical protein
LRLGSTSRSLKTTPFSRSASHTRLQPGHSALRSRKNVTVSSVPAVAPSASSFSARRLLSGSLHRPREAFLSTIAKATGRSIPRAESTQARRHCTRNGLMIRQILSTSRGLLRRTGQTADPKTVRPLDSLTCAPFPRVASNAMAAARASAQAKRWLKWREHALVGMLEVAQGRLQ